MIYLAPLGKPSFLPTEIHLPLLIATLFTVLQIHLRYQSTDKQMKEIWYVFVLVRISINMMKSMTN